jgi:hypothetical protein
MALPKPKLTASRAELIAYGRWLEEDEARAKLSHAAAWRAFTGGTLPTPTSAEAVKALATQAPTLREVKPEPHHESQDSSRASAAMTPVPYRPRVAPVPPPAPKPVLRPVPDRMQPAYSRYARHTLYECFHFVDPDEWLIRCTTHGSTRGARDFDHIYELLEDPYRWCHLCAGGWRNQEES